MMDRVLVYTREGCHCAAADVDVAPIYGELGLGCADADPELSAGYGDRLPVMVDGREHGFWRVDERRLRAALT